MPGIDIKVSAKVWNPLHFVEITQRRENVYLPFSGTFAPLKASVLLALGLTMRAANNEDICIGEEHMPMKC